MRKVLFLLFVTLGRVAVAQSPPIPVVAVENVYGDVVRQIGGGRVTVTSILTNPEQDPHLFEASPSVARNIAAARLVVLNGAGYDPWANKLLAASRSATRQVIDVGALAGKPPGSNPHIWYETATVERAAAAVAGALAAADPAHAAGYQRNLATFEQSLQPVNARIAALRTRLQGTAATATEPVFGLMLAALGMVNRNEGFQRAVMNDTEPSASDVVAFENDLRTHQVRLLVYNSQASSPTAKRMERLARASGIPVIGVTETEPPNTTYQAWLMSGLDAVDRALPR